MFLKIRIYLFVGKLPVLFPFDYVLPAVFQQNVPLRPDQCLGDTFFTSINLPCHAQHMDFIRIFVVDGEVIENLAVFRGGSYLSSPHSNGSNRVTLSGPIDYVQIMDMLFDDVITGEPREIQPVSKLPFHFAPTGLAILFPKPTLI